MQPDKPPTLGQIAIQRIGWRYAYRALGFAATWWIFTSREGRPPATVEEYASWWKTSLATAYRDRAAFRRAFPEVSTPTELAALIGYEVPSLKREQKSEIVVDLIGWTAPA